MAHEIKAGRTAGISVAAVLLLQCAITSALTLQGYDWKGATISPVVGSTSTTKPKYFSLYHGAAIIVDKSKRRADVQPEVSPRDYPNLADSVLPPAFIRVINSVGPAGWDPPEIFPSKHKVSAAYSPETRTTTTSPSPTTREETTLPTAERTAGTTTPSSGITRDPPTATPDILSTPRTYVRKVIVYKRVRVTTARTGDVTPESTTTAAPETPKQRRGQSKRRRKNRPKNGTNPTSTGLTRTRRPVFWNRTENPRLPATRGKPTGPPPRRLVRPLPIEQRKPPEPVPPPEQSKQTDTLKRLQSLEAVRRPHFGQALRRPSPARPVGQDHPLELEVSPQDIKADESTKLVEPLKRKPSVGPPGNLRFIQPLRRRPPTGPVKRPQPSELTRLPQITRTVEPPRTDLVEHSQSVGAQRSPYFTQPLNRNSPARPVEVPSEKKIPVVRAEDTDPGGRPGTVDHIKRFHSVGRPRNPYSAISLRRNSPAGTVGQPQRPDRPVEPAPSLETAGRPKTAGQVQRLQSEERWRTSYFAHSLKRNSPVEPVQYTQDQRLVDVAQAVGPDRSPNIIHSVERSQSVEIQKNPYYTQTSRRGSPEGRVEQHVENTESADHHKFADQVKRLESVGSVRRPDLTQALRRHSPKEPLKHPQLPEPLKRPQTTQPLRRVLMRPAKRAQTVESVWNPLPTEQVKQHPTTVQVNVAETGTSEGPQHAETERHPRVPETVAAAQPTENQKNLHDPGLVSPHPPRDEATIQLRRSQHTGTAKRKRPSHRRPGPQRRRRVTTTPATTTAPPSVTEVFTTSITVTTARPLRFGDRTAPVPTGPNGPTGRPGHTLPKPEPSPDLTHPRRPIRRKTGETLTNKSLQRLHPQTRRATNSDHLLSQDSEQQLSVVVPATGQNTSADQETALVNGQAEPATQSTAVGPEPQARTGDSYEDRDVIRVIGVPPVRRSWPPRRSDFKGHFFGPVRRVYGPFIPQRRFFPPVYPPAFTSYEDSTREDEDRQIIIPLRRPPLPAPSRLPFQGPRPPPRWEPPGTATATVQQHVRRPDPRPFPRPEQLVPVRTRTEEPRCDRFSEDICLDDFEYPAAAILDTIYRERHKFDVMYAEVRERSAQVEGITKKEEESYTINHYFGPNKDLSSPPRDYGRHSGFMCPSEIHYGRPRRAKNNNGDWKVIINVGDFKQTIRLEKCLQPNSPCTYVQDKFISTCHQVYGYQRLLAFDKGKGLHVDIFKIPSGCSCHLKGVVPYTTTPLQSALSHDYMASTSHGHSEAHGVSGDNDSISRTLWTILSRSKDFDPSMKEKLLQQLRKRPHLKDIRNPEAILKELLRGVESDGGKRAPTGHAADNGVLASSGHYGQDSGEALQHQVATTDLQRLPGSLPPSIAHHGHGDRVLDEPFGETGEYVQRPRQRPHPFQSSKEDFFAKYAGPKEPVRPEVPEDDPSFDATADDLMLAETLRQKPYGSNYYPGSSTTEEPSTTHDVAKKINFSYHPIIDYIRTK